jgi:hypothetical protein
MAVAAKASVQRQLRVARATVRGPTTNGCSAADRIRAPRNSFISGK